MLNFLFKLFPSKCLSCDSFAYSKPICENCMGKLEPYGEFVIKPNPPWKRSFAGFKFNDSIKNVIHRFKYEKGEHLAKFIYEQMKSTLNNVEKPDLIIPVPLSKVKLIKRGYNQSQRIAKFFAKKLNSKLCCDTLVCVEDISQIGKGKQERLNAVKGIYKCSASFDGKSILLVDDVMTTGATLNECTKVLKRNGAAKVDVFVIAKR